MKPILSDFEVALKVNLHLCKLITERFYYMPEQQPNNPLHGVTLEMMLNHLVEHYGWEELADHTKIKAFAVNPTLKSGLNFIRKTPWAKKKIEEIYLQSLRK